MVFYHLFKVPNRRLERKNKNGSGAQLWVVVGMSDGMMVLVARLGIRSFDFQANRSFFVPSFLTQFLSNLPWG